MLDVDNLVLPFVLLILVYYIKKKKQRTKSTTAVQQKYNLQVCVRLYWEKFTPVEILLKEEYDLEGDLTGIQIVYMTTLTVASLVHFLHL